MGGEGSAERRARVRVCVREGCETGVCVRVGAWHGGAPCLAAHAGDAPARAVNRGGARTSPYSPDTNDGLASLLCCAVSAMAPPCTSV